MEGLLDRTSPRRGSLNSLHRQSGSFTSTQHNPKPASKSAHYQATNSNHTTSNVQSSLSTTNNSITSTALPDLDKYTRYFIIKAVQIIVQSRVNGSKELRSDCKPNGNDWFNLNLSDVPEISERTKAAIDQERVSTKNDWRVCCEISLKTADETRVVLEQWIITNQAISLISTTPPSPIATTTSSNLTGSPSANQSPSSTIPIGTNTKPIQNGSPSLISNSNSTNSLSAQHQKQQTSNSSASGSPASIYTIYNRMTLLLKTLMTTAHIVPAFRLASKISRPSVICYRVYTVQTPSSSSPNVCPSSPIKYSPASLNNRSIETSSHLNGASDSFIDQHFGPSMKLGSIKTETNELSISYRTDLNSSNHLLGSPRGARDHAHLRNHWNNYGGSKGIIQDQDYLMAAKQLLAGNKNPTGADLRRNSVENLDYLDQPLIPAFATRIASSPTSVNHQSKESGPELNSPNGDNNKQPLSDSYGELIETAFENLLNTRNGNSNNHKNEVNSETISAAATSLGNSLGNQNGCQRSANIQVPKAKNIDNNFHQRRDRHRSTSNNQPSTGSTPKSLSDSYVFVDITPPFASEDQNDINSFFHGPSPSFSNGFDSLKDVEELTNQLATIEATASQIDDFVDNICASEEEEEDERR